MSGMRMSMRITSGRCWRATSMASSPVPASATTSMSSWIRRTMAKPPRTSAWSSTTATRMLMPARPRWAGGRRPGTRRPGAAGPPGSRPAVGPVPASRRCPCPADRRCCRSEPTGGSAGRNGPAAAEGGSEPLPSSTTSIDDPVPVAAEPHLGAGTGTGVLEHVGERLLDDAVREQVDAGRKLPRQPIRGQRDVQARPAGLLDEPGEVREAGLGAQPVEAGLRSQDPEQVAQLVQRLASGLLHRRHRPQGALGVLGGDGLGRARLHRHEAHPVGDHVVQLARDAGPLLDHDPARLGGLFPLQLGGALAAQPEPAPDVPGHEHDDGAEGCLPPRGRVGEAVDEDHGDGRGHAHLRPPVLGLGGVPARAVQGDDRHPAEVGVAAAERHRPGGHGHAEHGQGRAPAPVQRRAGHGEDQQGGDGDVADGADDDGVAGPVHQEHRHQEDHGREDGVRGAGPAGEGAPEPSRGVPERRSGGRGRAVHDHSMVRHAVARGGWPAGTGPP